MVSRAPPPTTSLWDAMCRHCVGEAMATGPRNRDEFMRAYAEALDRFIDQCDDDTLEGLVQHPETQGD